ncbi:MAG: cytochrome c [Azonexaceae bacterium]|uniref:c-type cytochrome n=1 Tax=Azonexus sp. R2A61 TaxID=2744443 RepID=UPI001F277BCC|nr:cytochrome c [Azonexus sp. R2A61]MCE1240822.1 cytochrome c [Azonexaceae bacterium]
MKSKLTLALVAATLAASAQAQVKVEDAIKWRQANYATMGWNMGRIKASLDGAYNKDEVIQAANVIQAIANSGMGKLYVPGSDKGSGFHETKVKPELFTEGAKVGKIAGDFNAAANDLAKVAATGDAAAVKAAFGKLGGTCKSCHDDFRNK